MPNLDLSDEYVLRTASLLDVPFIFDLVMDGSELGAFTDRYMVGTGGFNLFWFVLSGVLTRGKWPKPTAITSEWMVISKSASPIGFMKIETLDFYEGHARKLLALYAISPRHRDQGHGTAVLKLFIKAQPDETTLLVHCTKYARAMQHVLKKLRFKRNPKAGQPVEEYRLIKHEDGLFGD